MKPYPRWFKRLLVMVSSGLLMTGLLLVPTLLMLRADIEVPWHLASGQRTYAAAFHVLCAMMTLALVGSLWTVHMRAGWRKRRQRASGALLCGAIAVLSLSALVLHYSETEDTAALAAWVHVGVGVSLLPLFLWHGWLAHRKGKSDRRERRMKHV